MVTILITSTEMATLSLLEINILSNKDYDLIISFHGITNKTSSFASNYLVDVVISSKIRNSSIW